MKLQKAHKERLANHIAKKPIEYIELYNELYDHYATTYEIGNQSFEDSLEELDNHFHYQRVNRINDNLLKMTKRSVNEIYWREFKDFWRWPQVLATIGALILGIVLIESVSIKTVIWIFIIPMVIFNLSLLIYGPALSFFNKIGKKKFKSAHLNATQY